MSSFHPIGLTMPCARPSRLRSAIGGIGGNTKSVCVIPHATKGRAAREELEWSVCWIAWLKDERLFRGRQENRSALRLLDRRARVERYDLVDAVAAQLDDAVRADRPDDVAGQQEPAGG